MSRTDTASLFIAAPPDAVFRAFERDALMAWLPPPNMTGRLLEYEFRAGGRYRMELTYRDGATLGKSTGSTDVSTGRFLAIEPGRRIVQTVEFESDDRSFAGEMIMTWSFDGTPRGTKVSVTADNVPSGIHEEDHATGMRSSLANLARYVNEGGGQSV